MPGLDVASVALLRLEEDLALLAPEQSHVVDLVGAFQGSLSVALKSGSFKKGWVEDGLGV